ncbi:MAG: glycosyltransferase family 4 protein [Candidatus Levybacteria bacterium]|nr:glycosyltransferase family 4 protein [Candidatus Levybacteria bacterium]
MRKADKQLRIGIDGRYIESGGGGINRYIQELIHGIIDAGDTPVVISTQKIAIQDKNVEYIVLPKKGHWIFWEQIQLPLLLSKLNLDTYHACANSGIPIFLDIPTILTIHDIIPLQDKGYFNQSTLPYIAKILYILGLKISLYKSNAVIGTSKVILDDVSKYFTYNSQKASVIPMGVGTAFFDSKKKTDHKILAKYSISTAYILNFGGIDKRKNIEGLLKAFALFSNSKSNKISLVITGGNKVQVNNYKKLAIKLGLQKRILFPGWMDRSDLPKVVRNAKFVVYPTFAEGFGLPVAETIASQIPIVTSQLPTIKALHKETPIYIDPKNIESIIAGMIQADKGISKARLSKGKKIIENYTWENTTKKTYAIYQTLLKK